VHAHGPVATLGSPQRAVRAMENYPAWGSWTGHKLGQAGSLGRPEISGARAEKHSGVNS